MTTPFVGEIRMFGGNFAPRGFALCDGQLLQVSQNDALFALIGTIYGGDGRTTFGLPDLRGRVPIHYGSGPGLSTRPIGQKAGEQTATVSAAELPAHSHALAASSGAATSSSPAGNLTANSGTTAIYGNASVGAVNMGAGAVPDSPGGTQPHNNVMPFQCVHFIIALTGVFPPRN